MEPKAHSTAAPIQTSGFDYGRYATYHTLKNLSHWYPDLWTNLVDLAYNDRPMETLCKQVEPVDT
jgi:hypothetical protein